MNPEWKGILLPGSYFSIDFLCDNTLLPGPKLVWVSAQANYT